MIDLENHRLALPKTWREVFGAYVIGSVYLLFLGLAILNLTQAVMIWPSLFWLVINLVFIVICHLDYGVELYKYIGSALAKQQYLSLSLSTESTDWMLSQGFGWGNIIFEMNKISLASIQSVEWTQGQASVSSGQDLNDWQVIIWYISDSITPTLHADFYPHESPLIIGSPSALKDVEILGLTCVEFLTMAGLKLTPSDQPHQFTVFNSST